MDRSIIRRRTYYNDVLMLDEYVGDWTTEQEAYERLPPNSVSVIDDPFGEPITVKYLHFVENMDWYFDF